MKSSKTRQRKENIELKCCITCGRDTYYFQCSSCRRGTVYNQESGKMRGRRDCRVVDAWIPLEDDYSEESNADSVCDD